MSAQHTPGPWEVKTREADLDYMISYGDAGNWLATVWNEDDSAEADARLIAAAPDMFDALGVAGQQLWNALEAAGIGNPGKNPAYNAIRAALSKATGA